MNYPVVHVPLYDVSIKALMMVCPVSIVTGQNEMFSQRERAEGLNVGHVVCPR